MGTLCSKEKLQKPMTDDLGLTIEQKLVLWETWSLIEENTTSVSVKIFVRFFSRHPGYTWYFQAVTGAPRSNLALNARVQSHFRVIITSIGTLLRTCIEKPKLLEGKFYYLAMVHKYMNLRLFDFHRFRDVTIEVISELFPKEMDVFSESSWYAFLTAVNVKIYNKIQDLLEEERVERKRRRLGLSKGFPSLRRMSYVDGVHEAFRTKYHQHGQGYWMGRKEFWKIQHEMWGEEMSEPGSEEESSSNVNTYDKKKKNDITQNI